MKERFIVLGLNTAATIIWCAGAVGSLCDMGKRYHVLKTEGQNTL
ncbi:hypothetical protein [Solitalea koreensis]|nr:hypothetical protein [Solitalea koreensis]